MSDLVVIVIIFEFWGGFLAMELFVIEEVIFVVCGVGIYVVFVFFWCFIGWLGREYGYFFGGCGFNGGCFFLFEVYVLEMEAYVLVK